MSLRLDTSGLLEGDLENVHTHQARLQPAAQAGQVQVQEQVQVQVPHLAARSGKYLAASPGRSSSPSSSLL